MKSKDKSSVKFKQVSCIELLLNNKIYQTQSFSFLYSLFYLFIVNRRFSYLRHLLEKKRTKEFPGGKFQ